MLSNDIELNGVAYNVVPGAYKKGLRKALAVSKPPARRIGNAIFDRSSGASSRRATRTTSAAGHR